MNKIRTCLFWHWEQLSTLAVFPTWVAELSFSVRHLCQSWWETSILANLGVSLCISWNRTEKEVFDSQMHTVRSFLRHPVGKNSIKEEVDGAWYGKALIIEVNCEVEKRIDTKGHWLCHSNHVSKSLHSLYGGKYQICVKKLRYHFPMLDSVPEIGIGTGIGRDIICTGDGYVCVCVCVGAGRRHGHWCFWTWFWNVSGLLKGRISSLSHFSVIKHNWAPVTVFRYKEETGREKCCSRCSGHGGWVSSIHPVSICAAAMWFLELTPASEEGSY